MRLAKLTLSGFKSFADRTEFRFDHAVTAIVGPNGCGKSNIVDAIKWVLGERSSKSLRGTEMLDVIFAGSAGRKPGGMASVALTFENPITDQFVDDSPPLLDLETGTEVASQAVDGLAEPLATEVSDAGMVAGVSGTVGTIASEEDSEQSGVPAGDSPTLASVADAEGAEGGASVIDVAARRRRVLPIDADMVEVERRLYRDGESAYLINGKKARLKDIRELFLDTGVGADAYSIIEQGKVDAMLLASPQERRVIFEEAAGIAKYKQRRVEAQRKLDRSQTNLTSAREELESTERRLRLVRGQAAKARKFQEHDGELKAWRLALAFEQYDDLEQRIFSVVSRHSGLTSDREERSRALAEMETAKQNGELVRQEATSRHKSLEQERLGAVHHEQQAAQRRSMLERAVADAQRQASLDRDRYVTTEQRRAETERGIEAHRTSVAEMAQHLGAAEAKLATAGEQRAAILETLNERRQAASAKVAAVTRIDRERVGLVASIQSDAKRAEAVRDQAERLREKSGRLEGDEAAVQSMITSVRSVVTSASADAKAIDVRLSELEEATGRLSSDRRVRAERVGKLDSEVVRADSRRATLQEMVDSRTGFAQAVRQVLAARDSEKGLFSGVIAPLADVVETRAGIDTEIAAAVEAALGSDLQGLVISGLANLPGREDFAAVKGRVTFLPMRGLPEGKPTAVAGTGPRISYDSGAPDASLSYGVDASLDLGLDVSLTDSRVVSLRRMVQPRAGSEGIIGADGGLDSLLDRLLGLTFLVEDIDTAMMLRAGPLAGGRCRFVTRVGSGGGGCSIIDADGRVFAGSAGAGDESTGILRRRIELEMLQSTVATLTAELTTERDALRSVDAEAGQMSAAASQARTQLAAAQRALLTEQNKLERLGADSQRLSRERSGIDQELKQLQERFQRLEDDRAKLRERAESLGRLQEEEQTAATELEAQVKLMNARAELALEQSTAAKIEVNKFGEQLHAARRELGRLEASRDDLTRQTRELDTQIQRLDARILEQDGMIEECVEQITTAQADVIRFTAESLAAQADSAKADAMVKEISLKTMEARNSYGEVERSWHSLELAKRELEVKRENLQERAAEDLSLDLQSEYGEYQQVMAGGEIARIDTSEAALKIDTLRDAIKKLGSVNIESIGEESTLAERNEGLVKQVGDIDAACAQLTELITKLNEVSRTLFGEVFTRIQHNFGSDSGMFRKLFNGGKAQVRLMPLMKEVEDADGTVRKIETDQTDLLESGIEVVAKPPGKEPRGINQLSGGEKTLTAVALLMSIFRSKPSCFCVLDEVDAALDEGNVGRFNSVVREYTDRSSFIVITHNKRTMQTADRLYGVTMQERGVSTRVSVRFDQVGKDGEIKSSAVAQQGEGAHAGTSPPRLRGAGEGSLLNTGLNHPPAATVVVIPQDSETPDRAEERKSMHRPRTSRQSKQAQPDPQTLREALAAMRDLAQPAREAPRSSGADN